MLDIQNNTDLLKPVYQKKKANKKILVKKIAAQFL